MFDKVMVGIDEITRGRDAIALARQLVSGHGELTLAHVHAGYPLSAKGANYEFEATQRERARSLLSEALAESGVSAATLSLGASGVGRGLHELAESDGSDLLVIGSDRRTPSGRVWIHDATSQALAGAPCALAIAPSDYAEHPNPLREIGVAFNGSPESQDALAVARLLAAQHHAKLSAFEAVDPTGHTPRSHDPGDAAETIEASVASTLRRLAALGNLEAHAACGAPTTELTVYSASIDLLVIGSRGYGALGRLVHGSVTRELARSAKSPLLILTPRAEQTTAHAPGEPMKLTATV